MEYGGSIGIVIGFIFSKAIIYIVNVMLEDYMYDVMNLSFIFNKIDFYMKVPIIYLLIVLFIVILTTFLSSRLSLIKIDKNIMQMLRNSSDIKIDKKSLNKSSIVKWLFNIEGEIGYKNIKRDKLKSRTVVTSLAVSIILFLTISGFINNYYKTGVLGSLLNFSDSESFKDFNFFTFDLGKTKDVVRYLEENNLINDYYIYEDYMSEDLCISNKNLSDDMKKLIGKDDIYVQSNILHYYGKSYENILKKAGIRELKDNEVIITNTLKTKDGKIKLTNYKIGDNYSIKTKNGEKTLKIAAIVENFKPYSSEYFIALPIVEQLVNENTFKNISNQETYNLAIKTDRPTDVEQNMEKINEILDRTSNCP